MSYIRWPRLLFWSEFFTMWLTHILEEFCTHRLFHKNVNHILLKKQMCVGFFNSQLLQKFRSEKQMRLHSALETADIAKNAIGFVTAFLILSSWAGKSKAETTTTHSDFKWLKPAKNKFTYFWFHEFFQIDFSRFSSFPFPVITFETCQIIESINVKTQFQKFSYVIFGGFLLFETFVRHDSDQIIHFSKITYLRIRMIRKNWAIRLTSVSCPTDVELTKAMLT